MDFFDRQHHARRQTATLLAVFAAAVAVIVLAVLAVAWAVFAIHHHYTSDYPYPGFITWLGTATAGWTVAVTLGVIAVGSIKRLWELRQGGGARVARMMGGTPVETLKQDAETRRLVQVVEEMAVASGLPRPGIYVLEDEAGLNAFAAGTRPRNAIVAVTRGLLESLDRDELQGVMAHEMSHILNNDTRINMRLIAIMAGITLIGELGIWFWRILLFDTLASSGYHGSSHHRRGGLGAHGGGDARGLLILVLVALGAVVLIAIGWIGVFMARLIKAAVSRQREFLADAAAVQFTRYPDGIAGALLRIHNAASGTSLRASHAEEISHMGFGRISSGFSQLTATHPSIEDRLTALGIKYKYWLRDQQQSEKRAQRASEDRNNSETGETGGEARDTAAYGGGGGSPADAFTGVPDSAGEIFSIAALAALAGQLNGSGLKRAQRLLARIPDSIRDALHSPRGATQVVLALMMHGPDCESADRAALPEDQVETITGLRDVLTRSCPGDSPGTLDPASRLALVELAIPALTRLEADQRQPFVDTIDALVRANNRISIFEFAARSLVTENLSDAGNKGIGVDKLQQHAEDSRSVLSLLAHVGHDSTEARDKAYAQATKALGINLPETPLALEECSLKAFSAALKRLDKLQPRHKRQFLYAAAECMAADGRVRPAEAELLRVLAATLEVPIPLGSGS
jgi:Zn-dependent protease with chaperone function